MKPSTALTLAAGGGSDDEFLELFGCLDGATIDSRYLDACTTLQTSATSCGLDVDLPCLR